MKTIETKKVMENVVIGYPFVDHVDQNARPEISDPGEFLKKAYVRYFTNNENLIHFGYYKSLGYLFDFKPYLKKYLYKQYGHWSEAYAPNKTLLRQVIYGKIDQIIELK